MPPRTETLGTSFRPIKTLVNETIELLEFHLQNPNHLFGLTTGFTNLDALLHGLRAGQLVILGGAIASGKTSLAMNLAHHVALDFPTGCAAIFSELKPTELTFRMLYSQASIPIWDIHLCGLSRSESCALARSSRSLTQSPFYIANAADVEFSNLEANLRNINPMTESGVRFLVLDGLQQMLSESTAPKSLWETIAPDLKRLAVKLNMTILATAHLVQTPETGLLQPPDLTDFGPALPLAQHADIVMMLTRVADPKEVPSSEDDETEPTTPINRLLTVVKNRNGPLGQVPLHFDEPCMRFVDPEASLRAQESNSV